MSKNIGSITFGPCNEPVKIKSFQDQYGELASKIDEDFDERPDYIVPQFNSDTVKNNKKHKYLVKSDTKETKSNALDRQVGGSHYKQYKIQPYEFFIANQTPHHKAAICRRILRYDHPTGKGLEDLLKIKHEVDLIILLEGWEDKDSGSATAKKEG